MSEQGTPRTTATISDEDIVRVVRNALKMFREDRSGNVGKLGASSAALFLVGEAVRQAAGEMSVTVGGVTIADELVGDWIVTVRRADHRELSPEDTPHVLAGVLKHDRIDDAIDAFAKLTYMSVGVKEDTAING